MIRQALLAGAWYPDDERSCRAAIDAHAANTEPQIAPWRGIIAPHAGWFYSGDAAGHAFRWLGEARPDADLVIVFGSHRGAEGPNTIFCDDGWNTPIGTLAAAVPLAEELRRALSLKAEPVAPRQADNAVEVQLPFVRHFFPKAELLMLGVAASEQAVAIGRAVAEVCQRAERDTVIVGSTDLTHYGPNYGFMPHGAGDEAVAWVREHNDKGFLERVLAGDVLGLLDHARRDSSACCPGAVAAALAAAHAMGDGGARHLVDHYLSYDIRPSSSFVGYAGVVF